MLKMHYRELKCTGLQFSKGVNYYKNLAKLIARFRFIFFFYHPFQSYQIPHFYPTCILY